MFIHTIIVRDWQRFCEQTTFLRTNELFVNNEWMNNLDRSEKRSFFETNEKYDRS